MTDQEQVVEVREGVEVGGGGESVVVVDWDLAAELGGVCGRGRGGGPNPSVFGLFPLPLSISLTSLKSSRKSLALSTFPTLKPSSPSTSLLSRNSKQSFSLLTASTETLTPL